MAEPFELGRHRQGVALGAAEAGKALKAEQDAHRSTLHSARRGRKPRGGAPDGGEFDKIPPEMRILDVTPRAVWPPDNGSTYRMYHLMRELSERHEVRQFSQPLSSQMRDREFTTDVWPNESYREHRNQSWLAAAASELCNR